MTQPGDPFIPQAVLRALLSSHCLPPPRVFPARLFHRCPQLCDRDVVLVPLNVEPPQGPAMPGSSPRPPLALALSLPFIFHVTYVHLAAVVALPGKRHMSLFRVIHFAAFTRAGAPRRQAPSRVSGSIWPRAGGSGGRRPAAPWRAHQSWHFALESVLGRCQGRARPQVGDRRQESPP